MEKVICGIVTYNPNITRLKKNIEQIIKQVAEIIICDNGSTNYNEMVEIVEKYKSNYEITIISFKENMGIAYALNTMCKYSFEKKYEWIYTLDQDSISPSNIIEEFLKYVTINNIGMVVPFISYEGNEKYYIKSKNDVEEAEWAITSASLTNLMAWKEINGFDSQLFIDKVDLDYCIRLKRKGYKILRINKVELKHELGNMKCKRILGKIIHITNHSAFRYYYMSRNAIIIKKKLNYREAIYGNFKKHI